MSLQAVNGMGGNRRENVPVLADYWSVIRADSSPGGWGVWEGQTRFFLLLCVRIPILCLMVQSSVTLSLTPRLKWE